MRFMTAALLLTLTASPAFAGQKETETIDRTAPIGANGSLKLKNFSGAVRITGTNSHEVVIHAVRRAKREQLDNIKLDVVTSGTSVTIEANKRTEGWRDKNDNVVETDFDIKVPFGTELDLYSFSGRIEVTGVRAKINAETFSGNVMLDVADAAELPALTGETFSGDIRLKVPDSASGRVEFNSFSGSVESDVPIAMKSNRKRDVSGDIGSGSGPTLKFKTFSGDLRIQK
jgi:Putative adhesin